MMSAGSVAPVRRPASGAARETCPATVATVQSAMDPDGEVVAQGTGQDVDR